MFSIAILYRIRHALKISVTHVGLVALTSIYTLLGALFFYHLEDPEERIVRNQTMFSMREKREMIVNRLWEMTQNLSEIEWKQTADKDILKVMLDMYKPYVKNFLLPRDLINNTGGTRWSFPASVFFAWTSLTTIGYGHIVPRTVYGRVGILLYALLGIPLVLVTIADMGRFLSKGVIWLHEKLRSGCKRCLDGVWNKLRGRSQCYRFTNEGESLEERKKRISVLFIILLLLIYTTGGAFLFQSWENWDFFNSFYFCFVTITTIGFGDIVVEEESVYFSAILIYIVVGLTLTTMCVDMLGSEYLGDIHFYGRNIKKLTRRFGLRTQDTIVSLLQKTFGLTLEQIEDLENLPADQLDDYILDCIRMGIVPDFKWPFARPYIPKDIRNLRWAESSTASHDITPVFATMNGGEFPGTSARLQFPDPPLSLMPSPRVFDGSEEESLM